MAAISARGALPLNSRNLVDVPPGSPLRTSRGIFAPGYMTVGTFPGSSNSHSRGRRTGCRIGARYVDWCVNFGRMLLCKTSGLHVCVRFTEGVSANLSMSVVALPGGRRGVTVVTSPRQTSREGGFPQGLIFWLQRLQTEDTKRSLKWDGSPGGMEPLRASPVRVPRDAQEDIHHGTAEV